MSVRVKSRSELEAGVKKMLKGLLGEGRQNVSGTEVFIEMGMTSVLAVNLVEAINERFELDMGIEAVFDYPTTKLLASHIREQLTAQQKKEPITAKEGNSMAEAVAGMPDLLWKVSGIIARVLDQPVSQLTPDAAFIELGMNSVSAVQLTEEINLLLEIPLGVEVMYECSTFAELMQRIEHTATVGRAEEEVSTEAELPAVERVSLKEQPLKADHCFCADSDVAVIGMAGRFPGVNNPVQLWKCLEQGAVTTGLIKREEWERRGLSGYDKAGEWGGLLQDIDRFDAPFFGVTRQEAEGMDPQQRLLLEQAYQAFENAGYSMKQLSGRPVGVFIGGRASGYGQSQEGRKQSDDYKPVSFLGTEPSVLASRIAYFFHLKGPSLVVDTACSSAVTALHLACGSIRQNESEMALVGGVFVASTPEFFNKSAQEGLLSPDGQCRTLDPMANGMVLSEGVGAVVVKRLSAAERDGDYIYGVIKGSAIGHSGRTNGLSSPGMNAQKEVIRKAYELASVLPDTVSYMEIHGTGTRIGDTIEVKALTEAFHSPTSRAPFCLMGSHKPNLGHSTYTSGLASLMKVLLSMQHRKLPGLANGERIAAENGLKQGPFYLSGETSDWLGHSGYPLRAGINVLGSNGTNGHVIVEEYISRRDMKEEKEQPRLYVFSARDPEALRRNVKEFAEWLREDGERYSLAEIEYTLAVCRNHFPLRLAFLADNAVELADLLDKAFSANRAEQAGGRIYRGQAAPDIRLTTEDVLNSDDLMSEISLMNADRVSRGVKLRELALLYIHGLEPKEGAWFEKQGLRRVPLPSYSFLGERYWINHVYAVEAGERDDVPDARIHTAGQQPLHPLLHRNVSVFGHVGYQSLFTGEEPLFSDHVVEGRSILPGAAVLEMVRAGWSEAAGMQTGDGAKELAFTDIVWLRPVTAAPGRPVQLNLRLKEDSDDGAAAFELLEGQEPSLVLACQGKVHPGEIAGQLRTVNLSQLQEHPWTAVLSGSACYKAFSQAGIQYGPAYQGIGQVWLNKGELLVRLKLPESTAAAKPGTLHPSLLDSAWQAALLLHSGAGSEGQAVRAAFAFRLKQFILYSVPAASAELWAWVRREYEGGSPDRRQSKYNMDICDSSGRIHIVVRGFALREAAVLSPVESQPRISGIENLLISLASGLQQVSPKDIDLLTGFGEAGFDRLLLLRLADAVNRHLNTEIDEHVLLECGNLKRLAKHLMEAIEAAPQPLSGHIVRLDGRNPAGLRMASMDNILSRLLLGQLQSIGLLNVTDLERDGYNPLSGFYGRWYEQSIHFLKQTGWLAADSILGLVPKMDVDRSAAWELWDTAKEGWLASPETRAQAILVEQMLRALPAIVTGSKKATDVMFPEASLELVEGIYKHNSVADYYNDVLAGEVMKYVLKRTDSQPAVQLRILEIGAGTGGTSLSVLKKLAPYSSSLLEYCYTDVSPVFLQHAEEHYAASYPFLTCKLFNTEKPAKDQGVPLGVYDVVIATNVLHATKSMRRTMEVVRSLLKDDGVLLVNEISGNSLFLHLTFGLLQGWWDYEDDELRIAGCPGLTSESWCKLLTNTGFEAVAFPAEHAHSAGQQVIVAQNGKALRPILSPSVDSASHDYETIKAVIMECIRTLLQSRHPVEETKAFRDYGIDSLTGVKLIKSLNEQFGLQLDSTIIFDYCSVQELASYILQSSAAVKAGPVQPVSPLDEKSGIRNAASAVRGAPLNIAVIGMSGRFAGSPDLDAFWSHLEQGNCLIQEASRFDFPEAFRLDKSLYSKRGSFMDGIDEFDPLFFNVSGREALYMDPQQRLFLEEAWCALENAGYAHDQAQGGQWGVYAGCRKSDYSLHFGDNVPAQAFWGNESSLIPSRISYFLNLQGPAIAVDTACSSSLTAVHLACQDLLSGRVNMALAGGVFLSSPEFYYSCNSAGMLSGGGHCYTFDKRADGFVPGEGVGVLILKKLEDAERDGDYIYGVIAGSGVNQDGATNGITAPSAKAQETLERQVYESCGVYPGQIQMVEAHGTGTELGDPIEFKALTSAFRGYTDKRDFCALGSLKTNIGHLVTAAGVAGVMKVLLSLQHQKIPPSLHFDQGNENIDFEDSPFYVNTRLREWLPETGVKRYGAVSSFGFGGTNAHLVVGEPPLPQRMHAQKPGYIIGVSARTEEELRRQAERLFAYCAKHSEADAGNISFSLLTGRKRFGHRFACIAADAADLSEKLRKWLSKEEDAACYESRGGALPLRSQSAMQRFGEACILQCQTEREQGAYLEQLSSIAELFVMGYELEYSLLFQEGGYTRVPLPSYPFTRKKYWAGRAETQDTGGTGETAWSEELAAVSNGSSKLPSVSGLTAKPAAVSDWRGKEPRVQQTTEAAKVRLAPLADVEDEILHKAAGGGSERSVLTEPKEIGVLPEEKIHYQNSEERLILLQASMAECLDIGRDEIDPDRKFIELGLDSIMAVEWIRRVNRQFGTAVKTTRVYDYPTLHEFERYLTGQEPGVSGAGEDNERPAASDPALQAGTDGVLGELTGMAAKTLDIEARNIDPLSRFTDLGMDSILGVEWIQAVNRRFKTAVKATKVYDYPCLREFAGYMDEVLAQGTGTLPSSAPTKPPAVQLTMESILTKVQQGEISVEQANEWLDEITTKEGIMA